jgi:hypothetical protein
MKPAARQFHLFLLPLYFIAHKFIVLCRPFEVADVSNGWLWFGNFLLCTFYAALPLAVAYLFLSRIIKIDLLLAGLITTFLFSILYFESELEILNEYSFLRKRYIIPVIVVLIGFFLYRSHKSEKFKFHLVNYLNLVLAALILYNVVLTITTLNRFEPKAYSVTQRDFAVTCDQCPDIYYIILDAYTSDQSLRKYWSYDNSGFTGELTEMGFVVAPESKTQFDRTYYSLASSFNMISDSAGINQLGRYEVLDLLKKSVVTAKLSQAGYELLNLSFLAVGNEKAHYTFSNVEEGNDKSTFLRFLNNTVVKSVFNSMSEMEGYEQTRNILTSLETLSKQQSSKPKFVYAHFLSPHHPYVIDSSSNKVPYLHIAKPTDKDAYLNQLKGLNRLLLTTVRSIMDNYRGKNMPVIIIQGDHGFRYLDGNRKHPEAATILNAYFLPGKKHVIYDQISPYNTFRVIFKEYFNSNIQLLPEK